MLPVDSGIHYSKVESKSLKTEKENHSYDSHVEKLLKNVNHYSGNLKTECFSRSCIVFPGTFENGMKIKDEKEDSEKILKTSLDKYQFSQVYVSPFKKLKSLNTFVSMNNRDLKEIKWNENCKEEDVKFLEAMNNKLCIFPSKILKCESLIFLKLDHNNLKRIPDELTNIPLEFLSLSNNAMDYFPANPNVWKTSLKKLNLSKNRFKTFPSLIPNLDKIQNLDLEFNLILEIPLNFKNCKKSLTEFSFEWFNYILQYECIKLKGDLLEKFFADLQDPKLSNDKKSISFISLFRKYFLRQNLDMRLNGGKTFLHMASSNQHLSVVKSLINENATLLEIQDYDGYSVLGCSIKENKLQAIKLLLDCKASLNSGAGSHISQIFLLLYKKNPIVKELNQNLFDFNVIDKDGNNILHYLSYYFIPELAIKALEAGVNANQLNKANLAPIHSVVKFKNHQYLEWILDLNKKCVQDIFNINLHGFSNNCSTLAFCCDQNDSKSCILLLKSGANLFARDKNNKMPMEFIANTNCDILTAKIFWSFKKRSLKKHFFDNNIMKSEIERFDTLNKLEEIDIAERMKEKTQILKGMKSLKKMTNYNFPNIEKIKEIAKLKHEESLINFSNLSGIDDEKSRNEKINFPVDRLYFTRNLSNLKNKNGNIENEWKEKVENYVNQLEISIKEAEETISESEYFKYLLKIRLIISRILPLKRIYPSNSNFVKRVETMLELMVESAFGNERNPLTLPLVLKIYFSFNQKIHFREKLQSEMTNFMKFEFFQGQVKSN